MFVISLFMVRCEGGVTGEGNLGGKQKYYSWTRCIMVLNNMHSVGCSLWIWELFNIT